MSSARKLMDREGTKVNKILKCGFNANSVQFNSMWVHALRSACLHNKVQIKGGPVSSRPNSLEFHTKNENPRQIHQLKEDT